jgi:hypothetical protein
MEFKLVQTIISRIIETIQNTAIASVRAIKENVFNVNIKNFPKTQDIKGTVVVGNQRKVEKLLKDLKKINVSFFKEAGNNEYSVKVTNLKDKINIENLKDLELSTKESNKLLSDLALEIKKLQTLSKALDKKEIKIANQVELKPVLKSIKDLSAWLKKQEFSPKINVEAPIIPEPVINQPAPIVNVKKETYNFDKLVKKLSKELFQKSSKKYISVRLSDGDKFYEAMKEMMAISSGGGGGKYAFKDSDGNKNQALIDEDRHIQTDILTMPDGDIIGAIENIPTIDVSDLATSANQDSLIAKFPFEDYQYMGTDSDSSVTYKYVAFVKFSNVGFYCMRIHKTNANDVAYYYDADGTAANFTTFWADPSDAGFTYINPING